MGCGFGLLGRMRSPRTRRSWPSVFLDLRVGKEQLREQTIDHRLLMPEPKTQQGTQASDKNNGEKRRHADGAAEEIAWRNSDQETDNRVQSFNEFSVRVQLLCHLMDHTGIVSHASSLSLARDSCIYADCRR